jgi:hypothetical protein
VVSSGVRGLLRRGATGAVNEEAKQKICVGAAIVTQQASAGCVIYKQACVREERRGGRSKPWRRLARAERGEQHRRQQSSPAQKIDPPQRLCAPWTYVITEQPQRRQVRAGSRLCAEMCCGARTVVVVRWSRARCVTCAKAAHRRAKRQRWNRQMEAAGTRADHPHATPKAADGEAS